MENSNNNIMNLERYYSNCDQRALADRLYIAIAENNQVVVDEIIEVIRMRNNNNN